MSHVLHTAEGLTSHTAIADMLMGAIQEWGLTSKDPAVMMDNAANMVRAVEIMQLMHVGYYVIDDFQSIYLFLFFFCLIQQQNTDGNDADEGAEEMGEATLPKKPKKSSTLESVIGAVYSPTVKFSTAGDTVTARRSCLTPEHANELLFLHKNLTMS